MAKQEYEAVVFTEGLNKNGWKVSPTIRGGDLLKALQDLEAIIAYMEEEGYVPFVSYYNKAFENVQPTIVPQEQSLASEPPPPENFPIGDQAVALGGVPMEDGTMYLGMKPGKLEDILENQSYSVPANSYSFDGTWVNFYWENQQVAGHYYATKTGQNIFKSMFPLWVPVLNADKSPIPTGSVVLYIVGVKGKKSNDIYQNIKKADPA